MNRLYTLRTLTGIVIISILILLGFHQSTNAHAAGWNFTVPAREVQPENGLFLFPVAAFHDGKAKHFQFTNGLGQTIRFFLVKSTDGVIRAAFDACEVCWKAKKGYVQQGDFMVCINCGLKFRTDKVNELTGGCNPSPLARTVKDGKVIITVQDVLKGLRFFQ